MKFAGPNAVVAATMSFTCTSSSAIPSSWRMASLKGGVTRFRFFRSLRGAITFTLAATFVPNEIFGDGKIEDGA